MDILVILFWRETKIALVSFSQRPVQKNVFHNVCRDETYNLTKRHGLFLQFTLLFIYAPKLQGRFTQEPMYTCTRKLRGIHMCIYSLVDLYRERSHESHGFLVVYMLTTIFIWEPWLSSCLYANNHFHVIGVSSPQKVLILRYG